MVKEIFKSTIFDSTCMTIVNTVNCEGVMGKGLALEYKLRYPDMFEHYKQVCQRKELKPGRLLLYTGSSPWILNFPTKDRWKFPSKYEYIESGLEKFAATYEDKDISSIAFPMLGTNAGGLDEHTVLSMMLKYLGPLKNITVEIYHYDKDSKDSMFDQLYQKIYRMSVADVKQFVGLRTQEGNILLDAVNGGIVTTMLDIQKLDGFGEKSIKKLYDFLANHENCNINLDDDQLDIFC